MTSYSKVALDSNLWFNTKLIHGWPPQARSPAPVVLVALVMVHWGILLDLLVGK